MQIVTEAAVKASITLADAIELVEAAFVAAASGAVLGFPPLLGRGADLRLLAGSA